MKAVDYDKINPYFRNEIEKYNDKCLESNISIHFNNSFFYKIQKYGHSKNLIKLIERSDFSDRYKMQVLLNKKNIDCKEQELSDAKINFKKEEKNLFEFLDKNKDPYFFILMPYYKFSQGISYRNIPYKKDNTSGIQNLDIAVDYFNYVFNKKLSLL